MRFEQGRNTYTSLNECVVHFSRQTVAFAQHSLESCAQLAEPKLVNAPHSSCHQQETKGYKPGGSVGVRLLRHLRGRFGDLLRIVHLESSHAKVVSTGRKVGVVGDAVARGLTPIF